VENAIPNLGDAMYRTVQMGENVAPMGDNYGTDPLPSTYDEAVEVIAKNGWSFQQHTIGLDQSRQIIDIWEQVHARYPIDTYRWSLGHIFEMDVPEFDRLHAMGAGAALHSLKYTTHTYAPGVIPYRTAYEHPIRATGGTDGGNITTINPWNALYFMTTGLNTAGEQVLGTGPDGETVTRRQALQMYTRDAAWFTFDEHQLGSLEAGKLADLVVLTEDYDTVPDERLRLVQSVLTILDGNIVYSNGQLLTCANADAQGVWYPKAAGERCETR
jgi:predicted amidohydrolase YtcJ